MRHFLLATSLLLAPHIAMAGQCPAPPPVEPPSPTAVIVPEHNTQAQPRRLSAEDIGRSPAVDFHRELTREGYKFPLRI
ncbi:hypothetical protein, partial [Acetobacter fabarum]|uniref:hypothetical protein n=1 Tax=Acetobacter fabarum TaxID=483199 RepID=UPI001C52BC7B